VAFETKMEKLSEAKTQFNALSMTPNEALKAGIKVNQDGVRRSAMDFLGFRDVDAKALVAVWPQLGALDDEIVQQVERDAIYAGFIDRQKADVAAMRRDEGLRIPTTLDYGQITGLSNELRQKLSAVRPATLGQAGRIDGMTPAGLALILANIRKLQAKKRA
jgi:tRNA uridine 5-carboxymethylaminomethyl modification enzyme